MDNRSSASSTKRRNTGSKRGFRCFTVCRGEREPYTQIHISAVQSRGWQSVRAEDNVFVAIFGKRPGPAFFQWYKRWANAMYVSMVVGLIFIFVTLGNGVPPEHHIQGASIPPACGLFSLLCLPFLLCMILICSTELIKHVAMCFEAWFLLSQSFMACLMLCMMLQWTVQVVAPALVLFIGSIPVVFMDATPSFIRAKALPAVCLTCLGVFYLLLMPLQGNQVIVDAAVFDTPNVRWGVVSNYWNCICEFSLLALKFFTIIFTGSDCYIVLNQRISHQGSLRTTDTSTKRRSGRKVRRMRAESRCEHVLQDRKKNLRTFVAETRDEFHINTWESLFACLIFREDVGPSVWTARLRMIYVRFKFFIDASWWISLCAYILVFCGKLHKNYCYVALIGYLKPVLEILLMNPFIFKQLMKSFAVIFLLAQMLTCLMAFFDMFFWDVRCLGVSLWFISCVDTVFTDAAVLSLRRGSARWSQVLGMCGFLAVYLVCMHCDYFTDANYRIIVYGSAQMPLSHFTARRCIMLMLYFFKMMYSQWVAPNAFALLKSRLQRADTTKKSNFSDTIKLVLESEGRLRRETAGLAKKGKVQAVRIAQKTSRTTAQLSSKARRKTLSSKARRKTTSRARASTTVGEVGNGNGHSNGLANVRHVHSAREYNKSNIEMRELKRADTIAKPSSRAQEQQQEQGFGTASTCDLTRGPRRKADTMV